MDSISSALECLVAEIGSTVNLTLVLAIVWALNNDYGKYTSSAVILGQYATTRTALWHQNDLMQAVLVRSIGPQNQQEGMNVHFRINSNSTVAEDMHNESEQTGYKAFGSTHHALWFLDSMAAFDRLEADLLNEKKNYARNGYFCIIYTGQEVDRLQNLKIIFRRLFQIYVININVFLVIDDVPYVITYFPYRVLRCHAAQPEFYLSFHNIQEDARFSVRKKFFPTKTGNMYGCDLTVVTWENRPFIIFEKNSDKDNLVYLHGIEGQLLKLLAAGMNFTIKIVLPRVLDQGSVLTNGSTTGATEMIVEGHGNITIANFMYEKSRATVMLASHSYTSYPLVVLIPKGPLLSPFERLTKPFSHSIWYLLSASILLGIIVIFCVKCMRQREAHVFVFGQGNQTPFTNLWNILLGGLVPLNLPQRNFARYLLVIWLIYAMVLRNAYSGELFILLQDGRARNSLKSIREIVSQNYTFLTFPVLKDTLMEATKSKNLELIDKTKTTMRDAMDRMMTEEGKVVMTILEAIARSYNQEKQKENKRLYFLPEKLYNTLITLYMRRHSYLKHNINDLILRILAAGLVSRYEQLYLDSQLDRYRPRNTPVQLSIPLLKGPFSLYFCFVGLAAMVFLLELLAKKSLILRRAFEFFNC